MAVISSVAGQSLEPAIRRYINNRAKSSERAIITRMQRGIDEGEFVVPTNAAVITRYLIALTQGLSVQAQTGASRDNLIQVAHFALRGWPSA
jgi:hypothetical protein